MPGDMVDAQLSPPPEYSTSTFSPDEALEDTVVSQFRREAEWISFVGLYFFTLEGVSE